MKTKEKVPESLEELVKIVQEQRDLIKSLESRVIVLENLKKVKQTVSLNFIAKQIGKDFRDAKKIFDYAMENPKSSPLVLGEDFFLVNGRIKVVLPNFLAKWGQF